MDKMLSCHKKKNKQFAGKLLGIFIKISLNLQVQVMAWHQTGDKPLPKPMATKSHGITRDHKLTNLPLVPHICRSEWVSIGSDNDLLPIRHQAII